MMRRRTRCSVIPNLQVRVRNIRFHRFISPTPQVVRVLPLVYGRHERVFSLCVERRKSLSRHANSPKKGLSPDPQSLCLTSQGTTQFVSGLVPCVVSLPGPFRPCPSPERVSMTRDSFGQIRKSYSTTAYLSSYNKS